MCCSDGFGGQVCILDLQQSTQSTRPQVVANITVSDSPILCAAAIPTKYGKSVRPLTAAAPSSKIERTEEKVEVSSDKLQLGPTISVTSVTSSESRSSFNSSGSHDSHVPMSRDSSVSSMDDAVAILKTESHVGLDNGNENLIQNGHGSDEKSLGRGPDVVEETLNAMAKHKLKESMPMAKSGFRRVRSNSAPSFPDPQTIAQEVAKKNPSPLVNTSGGRGPKRSESTSHLSSPLSLIQSDLDVEGGGRDHCMWLGTEGGQILIYSARSNLRSRSSRECVKLPAPVHCIR